jgi:hypothetical protein
MVSQKVTRKWDSFYEEKKKKKKKEKKRKKEGSAPIGEHRCKHSLCKQQKDDAQKKKKGSKNNYVAKNANHSSGCWYPHPCPLRCLLLEPVKIKIK